MKQDWNTYLNGYVGWKRLLQSRLPNGNQVLSFSENVGGVLPASLKFSIVSSWPSTLATILVLTLIFFHDRRLKILLSLKDPEEKTIERRPRTSKARPSRKGREQSRIRKERTELTCPDVYVAFLKNLRRNCLENWWLYIQKRRRW